MEIVIRERLLYACVMPVVVKGIKYVHSPIDGAETASAHYLGALLRYDETGGDGWPVVGEKTVGQRGSKNSDFT